MKYSPEYIHQLMTEKLAGVINAMEEHYLDELIEEVPAVRHQWEEMQAIFSSENLESELLRLRDKEWRESRRLVNSRQTVIPLYLKIAAVAASITVIFLVTWGIHQKAIIPAENARKLVFNIPSQKHIELRLPDGNLINLSRKQGNIATGDALLNNTGDALSYKSGGLETGMNTLTVPAGMDYKINLIDGSEVWLNSATTIQFPFEFEGNTREITMNGEAYLKVAKNKEKPFIVHLPKSTVQVLGTEFNVNTYDPGAEKIALVEGLVRLKTGRDEIKVQPGYQAVYSETNGWSQESFDKEKVLAWRSGLYYFYDTRFEEICQVLSRWFGIKIVIDDPSIRTRRFAGVVDKNQPLEVFLDNLKAITAIDYSFKKDRQVLHFSDSLPTR